MQETFAPCRLGSESATRRIQYRSALALFCLVSLWLLLAAFILLAMWRHWAL